MQKEVAEERAGKVEVLGEDLEEMGEGLGLLQQERPVSDDMRKESLFLNTFER